MIHFNGAWNKVEQPVEWQRKLFPTKSKGKDLNLKSKLTVLNSRFISLALSPILCNGEDNTKLKHLNTLQLCVYPLQYLHYIYTIALVSPKQTAKFALTSH